VKVVRSASELRAEIAPQRHAGRTIGFVPTMGALHEGHLSLVRAARDQADVVVLSIFVNPLQFGPHEDLASYPRDERRDLELAENEKVDVAFLPTVEEMYPEDRATLVHVDGITDRFEGASRPGHFDGVATVVAKLFGLVQPDLAYFGRKDAQQVAVVKRMVADLSIPTTIVVCDIVREADGLALSSRNAYLTQDERGRATVLYRALRSGRDAYTASGRDGALRVMEAAVSAEAGVDLDYVEAVDPDTFADADGPTALLIIAARVGTTRLIDNLLVQRS
jgi:pantoate--beta-alanine ligase